MVKSVKHLVIEDDKYYSPARIAGIKAENSTAR